jgi:hypothetical protein
MAQEQRRGLTRSICDQHQRPAVNSLGASGQCGRPLVGRDVGLRVARTAVKPTALDVYPASEGLSAPRLGSYKAWAISVLKPFAPGLATGEARSENQLHMKPPGDRSNLRALAVTR